MQILACSRVATWLRRADFGINAIIGGVYPQVLAGHAVPPTLAVITSPFCEGVLDEDPPEADAETVALLNEDADRCAAMDDPRAYPALYVTPDGPIEVQAEVPTFHRDAYSVAIAIRYLVSNENLRRQSARDAAYTMEALHHSLRLFLADDDTGRNARRGKGQMIFVAQKARYGPWKESIGKAKAIAVFGMAFDIRNSNP